jgi:glutathione S-transferase
MAWVELVSVLAILQFFFFGSQVARARKRYGVKAPATTGNEVFERYFRVQMNTLELLVMFLPALWMAASVLRPAWIALLGVVYLCGRALYSMSYVADPSKRGAGYALSILPVFALLLIVVTGAVRQLLHTAS